MTISAQFRKEGNVTNDGSARAVDRNTETEKISYLAKNLLFAGVPEDELHRLGEMLKMRTYRQGALIFGEKEPSEVLYVLKKGRVRLYRLSSSGNQLTLDILGPGTIFGEKAVLGQPTYNVRAEASEESLVCLVTKSDIQRIITKLPQVATNILEIVGGRLRWLEDLAEDIGLRAAEAKIASLLLRLPGTSDALGRKTLAMRYTQADLAKMACVSRETMSQTLKRFSSRRLIDTAQGRHIRILEVEGLETLCRE